MKKQKKKIRDYAAVSPLREYSRNDGATHTDRTRFGRERENKRFVR